MSDLTPEQPDVDTSGTPQLSAGDAALIDRLIDSGFGEQGNDRFEAGTSRVLGLLSLLDVPPSVLNATPAKLLVDVTMARVMRSAEADLAGRIGTEVLGPRLDHAGAAAVDALTDNQWSLGSQSSEVLRVASLLSILDAPAPAPREKERLVESTWSRIQQSIEQTAFRMRFPAEEIPRARSRFSLREFVAIAASILLVGVILGPMIVGLREQTRETLCADNLGRAGIGFSLFANDHDGRLPAHASQPKLVKVPGPQGTGQWWTVGRVDSSHSANLFVLIQKGYAAASDLACPGNQHAPTADPAPDASDWRSSEQLSYSYQLFGAQPPRWSNGRTSLVLADRSPVIERARRGESFDPMTPSDNHSSRGQNALFNDAAVRYLQRPLLDNGDNIWLPRRLEHASHPSLKGTELPDGETDAFVGP